ncbi:MAG: hypothetical protein JKY98_04180 [Gammaproteobacteria bacterium]|nr:hypothetical protein [Gammaproteobacteria bacterium]
MEINTVSQCEDPDYYIVAVGGGSLRVPKIPGNRYYQKVVEWISAGGSVASYAAPAKPTDDQLFQDLIKNDQFKALVMALAKKAGFASAAALKTAWKAEL